MNVYVIPTKKQTRLGRGGAYGPVPRLCRSVRSIYGVFFFVRYVIGGGARRSMIYRGNGFVRVSRPLARKRRNVMAVVMGRRLDNGRIGKTVTNGVDDYVGRATTTEFVLVGKNRFSRND